LLFCWILEGTVAGFILLSSDCNRGASFVFSAAFGAGRFGMSRVSVFGGVGLEIERPLGGVADCWRGTSCLLPGGMRGGRLLFESSSIGGAFGTEGGRGSAIVGPADFCGGKVAEPRACVFGGRGTSLALPFCAPGGPAAEAGATPCAGGETRGSGIGIGNVEGPEGACLAPPTGVAGVAEGVEGGLFAPRSGRIKRT
jgi:hypothetical protein